jgi:uncharacterized protein (TIGR02996 family)
MDNDEAFLRAITDNPNDSSVRLVYADWLEERGDPRAEFLRVQQAFTEISPNATGYRDLCEQEQKLVRQLDPVWLQRVRRYTTAAPCRDIAALVPELVPFARTTTRLHPHRVAAPLPAWMSKVGGRFLWPASEPWPSCAECNVNLVPMLQLRSRDFPDVQFPAGTDLLQLFWCANEAAHGYQPAPHLWWRTAAAVESPRSDEPDLSAFPPEYEWARTIPFECAVYPERVIEYPVYEDDLADIAGREQAEHIRQLLDNIDIGPTDDLTERYYTESSLQNPGILACAELGMCPGSKIGGKPVFVYEGQQLDHLVTLSSWEVDSGSFRRWVAVEDQRLFAPPGEPLTWQRFFQESEFQPPQEVFGMQFGRTQRAHIYLCREREPWEVVVIIND